MLITLLIILICQNHREIIASNDIVAFENMECSLGLGRNYAGRCRRLQDCPPVLSNLRAGVSPPMCAFQVKAQSRQKLPIVCCESEPQKRTSYQKCQEYAQQSSNDLAVEPVLLPSNIPKVSGPESEQEQKPSQQDPETFLLLVVGGKDAVIGQFPYMAALGWKTSGVESKTSWLCGGTLISDEFVLTAAHCLKPVRGKGEVKEVLLGDVNLREGFPVPSRTIVPIQRIIPHPDWDEATKYNDIGLIQLERKVRLSKNVAPACLPQPSNRPESQPNVTVQGWGLKEFAGQQSETLQWVTLKRVNFRDCGKIYASDFSSVRIAASQFCAVSPDESSKDTCEGDSGSGLTIKGRRGTTVLGITSFGPKFCGLDKPGVYTNVQSFLEWIEDTVWPS